MKAVIVGRGLAGAWLAHELLNRGAEVNVYDDGLLDAASRVSAGIINPTTGRRPQLSWRGSTLIPLAHQAYAELEKATSVNPFSETPIRRVFSTTDDERLWQVAAEAGIGVEWKAIPPHSLEGVPMPFGGVEYNGAVVDTNATLRALEILDGIPIEQTHIDELEVGAADVVVWCTGWHASTHPLWSWLPWQPVKGEIIDAQIRGPLLTSVYLRGIWVIPANSPQPSQGTQLVHIGSTHEWNNLTTITTSEAKASLEEAARVLLDRDLTVTGQRAGIRPAMRTKRPVIGRHPKHPEHVILNGLGTKGALWAPWAARQLADHLVHGLPLDPEVSIQPWWTE